MRMKPASGAVHCRLPARWRARRLCAIAVLHCVVTGTPAAPQAGQAVEEPMHWDFVPGRYTLIGRDPDSLRTYTGSARIERQGPRLQLTRRIDGRRDVVYGVVRRADPGEAWVLAFKWPARQPMEMICLVGSDLDNYARLTCHWGIAGNPHRQPGMEAYFAQEPWDPLPP